MCERRTWTVTVRMPVGTMSALPVATGFTVSTQLSRLLLLPFQSLPALLPETVLLPAACTQ